MPRNQKLTKVIAGRTVQVVTTEPGGVLVLFDSGFKGQSRVAFRGQRITPHSKKKFQYAVVLNLRLLYKSFLFVRTLFVRFPLPPAPYPSA